MALQKSILVTALKMAMDAQSDKSINPALGREILAKDIANAIEAYILSGEVSTYGIGYQGTPVNSKGKIT